MFRLLVCGERTWTDREAIRREMRKAPPGTVVIEGEARGADRLAKSVAVELGFEVMPFPADWNKYGKSAGPIRNHAMLVLGKPHEVWAFMAHPETSKGTANMVKQAKKAGVPVKEFRE